MKDYITYGLIVSEEQLRLIRYMNIRLALESRHWKICCRHPALMSGKFKGIIKHVRLALFPTCKTSKYICIRESCIHYL